MQEFKSVPFEIKSFDEATGTIVIKHSNFGNIDRDGDIMQPGSFQKNYEETKTGRQFLLNHDKEKPLGVIQDTWETEDGAFTKARFGSWTLAQDIKAMVADKVVTDASFAFEPLQKDYVQTKSGRYARRLKEVRHTETSLLIGKTPANPLAGVVSLQKSLEEVKSSTEKVDDLQIKWLQQRLDEVKQSVEEKSSLNTEPTPPAIAIAPEPDSSEKEFADALYLLRLKM